MKHAPDLKPVDTPATPARALERWRHIPPARQRAVLDVINEDVEYLVNLALFNDEKPGAVAAAYDYRAALHALVALAGIRYPAMRGDTPEEASAAE